MSIENAYTRAIDILMNLDKVDCRQLAIELAKTEPVLFATLVSNINASQVVIPDWIHSVVNEILTNHKVAAIKLYRIETGEFLLESKIVMDNAFEYAAGLGLQVAVPLSDRTERPMSEENTKNFELIKASIRQRVGCSR